MSEPFLGEIRAFAFGFNPRGWAPCNGQLMAISSNSALFSLLGTTYGGDGRVTFGLPDLRGRVPMHFGQGPGLTMRTQGEQAGVENVTLLNSQMPIHSHLVQASAADGDVVAASNAFLASQGRGASVSPYTAATDGTQMNPGMLTPAGGNQAHVNMQPYLVINYCIATEGIFPSRN